MTVRVVWEEAEHSESGPVTYSFQECRVLVLDDQGQERLAVTSGRAWNDGEHPQASGLRDWGLADGCLVLSSTTAAGRAIRWCKQILASSALLGQDDRDVVRIHASPAKTIASGKEGRALGRPGFGNQSAYSGSPCAVFEYHGSGIGLLAALATGRLCSGDGLPLQ